ncbi:MAG: succinylglutamate desuccinylase/aspartoacylase family protein [Pseudomonadota bacterium]|nr:succinylglutamate desuccinylase/aspartoacylase family protein [Pseudomonadota bacterium]
MNPKTAGTAPASPPRPTHLRSHTFHGLAPGARLLVLGAVHGNETCGTQAIGQILAQIDSGALAIARGLVTFVPVTNPLAYQCQQRGGERNLNRNMRPSAIAQDFEDRVANALCPLLDAHDALLDLHSFHTGGAPFVMIGPQDNSGELEPFARSAEEMRLALHTGAPRVLEGWLDTYARGVQRRASAPLLPGASRAQSLASDTNYGVGTTEYMRSRGGYGVTLECGQHGDPQAVQVARHAIEQTLALLGIAPCLPLAPAPATREILRLVDVTDRDHEEDRFSRDWNSFDPVQAGELIGVRHGGAEVRAPADGFVVFPNPRAEVGNEWFYFAQRRAN